MQQIIIIGKIVIKQTTVGLAHTRPNYAVAVVYVMNTLLVLNWLLDLCINYAVAVCICYEYAIGMSSSGAFPKFM